MKLIYIAYDDGEDGRRTTPIAAFTKEIDAKEYGKSPWGHVGTMELYESVKDYENNNLKAVRERALAKLSPEEKKALGVELW